MWECIVNLLHIPDRCLTCIALHALRRGNALLPCRLTNWYSPKQEGAFQAAEALKLQQQCSAADAFGCYPNGMCTTLQAEGAQHHVFFHLSQICTALLGCRVAGCRVPCTLQRLFMSSADS